MNRSWPRRPRPGTTAKGLTEASLTLDVALRLEKLLQKEPGVEVVLTRRSDVYIPLEERTAIANRQNADLFLSIHANSSRNVAAKGIETYFLSFASSPERKRWRRARTPRPSAKCTSCPTSSRPSRSTQAG